MCAVSILINNSYKYFKKKYNYSNKKNMNRQFTKKMASIPFVVVIKFFFL